MFFASINDILGVLPPWLHILIISMLPVIELRGALPYGILVLHMSYTQVIPLCLIGNMLPVPLILLLAKKFLDWSQTANIKLIRKFGNWLRNHSMKRSARIEKASFWGLVLFVGIPLPGTGAWTGSIIASLLELKFGKSMLAVFLGVCVAAVLVSLLVQAGIMLA